MINNIFLIRDLFNYPDLFKFCLTPKDYLLKKSFLHSFQLNTNKFIDIEQTLMCL